jgi:hypothetical protein
MEWAWSQQSQTTMMECLCVSLSRSDEGLVQGVLLRDCHNTSIEVTGNVTLQYVLVFNCTSAAAPLLVTGSLTLVNAVFLYNLGVRINLRIM